MADGKRRRVAHSGFWRAGTAKAFSQATKRKCCMSNEPSGNATRRGFLGAATAATALTLSAPPASEAQAVKSADEMAQLTAASTPQPAATSTGGWKKPGAMAIP